MKRTGGEDPLRLEPEKAAVVVITQVAQNNTFRQVENLASEVYKRGVDNVTIWRYFCRTGLSYIRRAVPLLFNLIYISLRDAIFMLDSTGISCDRSLAQASCSSNLFAGG